MLKHSHHEPNPDDGYELQDVSVKVILASGVFMVVFTLGCYFVSFMFAKMLTADGRAPLSNYEAPPMATEHNDWTTDVRLQPTPAMDLEIHNAAQQDISNAFEPLSESPNIHRIPVNSALDYVAENGLPTWEAQSAQQ